MTTHARCLLSLVLLPAAVSVAIGDDAAQPVPLECPGTWLRAPLMGRRGWQGKGPEPIPEGRNILLDCDSHPRKPARLAGEPEVSRRADGLAIRFALDTFDDVLVRVVDRDGNVVRTLGCGVLGPNACQPFQPNSLKQEIVWDGKDGDGRPAPAGCRVEVAVGLRPRFEGFVGHRPGLLGDWVCGVEVDPKGRAYVAFVPVGYSDPLVLRFDREGNYLDMAYPSGPQALGGRSLASLYPHAETIDGKQVPTRVRVWTSFLALGLVEYRLFSPYRPLFPLRIDPKGAAWAAEANTGESWSLHYPSEKVCQRIFPVDDLDRFWLLQVFAANHADGGFAIDGCGFGYIATRTYEGWGVWPPVSYGNDKKAPGTVRKVDLRTGQLAADFDYNGTEKQPEKSAYLGTTQILGGKLDWKSLRARTEPDPAVDGPSRLPDICDLTVDGEGRILVADGYPRRVKIYRKDGLFLGEVAGLAIDDVERRFSQLRTIRAWGGAVWYLAVFAGEPSGKVRLVKTVGDPLRPTVVWHTALDASAWHVGIDNRASPALVWVGNGGGQATLTRIEDHGSKPGEPRHIGGLPAPHDRHLREPWAIAADASGALFVHDHGRRSLVRIGDEPGDWKELPIEEADLFNDRRQQSSPIALCYDAARSRLFVGYQDRTPGLRCFDRNLVEDKSFRLESPVDEQVLRERLRAAKPALKEDEIERQVKEWKRRGPGTWSGPAPYGPMLTADRQGNLYATDAARDLPFRSPRSPDIIRALSGGQRGDFYGVVRKYRPDGTIEHHSLCRLYHAGGSLAVDSRGNLYVFDLPQGDWEMMVHNFPLHDYGPGAWLRGYTMTRGGRPVADQSEICHLLKFGPAGGVRGTESELWAHRGVGIDSGGSCTCRWPGNLLAIDAADRIFAADHSHYQIKAFDAAGNLICRLGTWGNAQTVPTDSDSSRVGFHNIHGLAAAGDSLCVSDKDLRRIAKFRMEYRELKTARVP